MGAHKGNRRIDKPHKKAAENAGKHGVARNIVGFFHAKTADYLHNNYTEGKACKSVHCVIALKKSGKEGRRFIAAKRRGLRDISRRGAKRRNHKNSEED